MPNNAGFALQSLSTKLHHEVLAAFLTLLSPALLFIMLLLIMPQNERSIPMVVLFLCDVGMDWGPEPLLRSKDTDFPAPSSSTGITKIQGSFALTDNTGGAKETASDAVTQNMTSQPQESWGSSWLAHTAGAGLQRH